MFHKLRTFCANWAEDQASQMGAALAYYTLFSLAPLLIIAIGVAGWVYGQEASRGQVVVRIRDFIGAESADTVQTMLENFRYPPDNFWTAVVGIFMLWYGALGMFTQLRTSLHRIWRVQLKAQPLLAGWLKDYLLAFVMVMVTCIFVLCLLTASTIVPILVEEVGERIPGGPWIWTLSDFLASFCLITLLFAFTFRFMSDGHVRYRCIWGGAAISALLFTAGKMVIGYYLANSRLASTYGAAGSLVVFLVWVYYSAQIFFFGAEVIRIRINK